MVHGKNRIPYRIDRRLTGLADLNMMPLSRSGCSLSLKTHNMGNPGLLSLTSNTLLHDLLRGNHGLSGSQCRTAKLPKMISGSTACMRVMC